MSLPLRSLLLWFAWLAVAGCGSDHGTNGDATCGNLILEGDEECDDGADDCLDNCTRGCGNGQVDPLEQCDTGIGADAEGACPADCDDGDPCTTDTLAGFECGARCVHGNIIRSVDGDECCPMGVVSFDDNDCAIMCGNGVVEPGESCDTLIEMSAFACPEDCDDDEVCTTDTLTMSATCQAECSWVEITATASDGCCPTGGGDTDPDCSTTCGDGAVQDGETCDTAITSPAVGACPSSCNDDDPCTTDRLLSQGTCSAACQNAPITAPASGDGCCQPGGTALEDGDCGAVCGNGAKEAGESCDDSNTTSGDGCSATCTSEEAPLTAFRMTALRLRDPHVWLSILGSCLDVTDFMSSLGDGVNATFNKAIDGDGDPESDDPKKMPDGFLDLNVLLLFDPLDQSASSTPVSVVVMKECTAAADPVCTASAMDSTSSLTATNKTSGNCLGTISGTTHTGYMIEIPNAGSAGCFETGEGTFALSNPLFTLPFTRFQVAATYSGNPASGLVKGLMRGFLSEADATAAVLPEDVPVIGGRPFAGLLAGGEGNCATTSDRDMLSDGTRGWWFYLNFEAATVTYND